MPLLDRQKKAKQIGEIRLGLRVPSKSGKMRPSKGTSLRFTTRSQLVANDVAKKLGGEVIDTELMDGRRTFEVITSVDQVAVMVPPGISVISQNYEMWSKAGCARRCDGFTDQISNSACKCPADLDAREQASYLNPPTACKPISRLYLMLPYVADLGVWRVLSTGKMAADELASISKILQEADKAGIPIPAMFRMEQRIIPKVDEKPRECVVPVLDTPNTSLYDLMQLSGNGGYQSALPPVPDYALAAGGTNELSAPSTQQPRALEAKKSEEQAPVVPPKSERSVKTIDMNPEIDELFEIEKSELRKWWANTIPNASMPTGCTAAAVPEHRVQEVRRKLKDLKSSRAVAPDESEEIYDAEIVEDESSSPPIPSPKQEFGDPHAILKARCRERFIDPPTRLKIAFDLFNVRIKDIKELTDDQAWNFLDYIADPVVAEGIQDTNSAVDSIADAFGDVEVVNGEPF